MSYPPRSYGREEGRREVRRTDERDALNGPSTSFTSMEGAGSSTSGRSDMRSEGVNYSRRSNYDRHSDYSTSSGYRNGLADHRISGWSQRNETHGGASKHFERQIPSEKYSQSDLHRHWTHASREPARGSSSRNRAYNDHDSSSWRDRNSRSQNEEWQRGSFATRRERSRSPIERFDARPNQAAEEVLDYGQSSLEEPRKSNYKDSNGRRSSRSVDHHSDDKRSEKGSVRSSHGDGEADVRSDAGSRDERDRARLRYESATPIKTLKRKVSADTLGQNPRSGDGGRSDTNVQSRPSTYSNPLTFAGQGTGDESASSDMRHSYVESGGPPTSYEPNGDGVNSFSAKLPEAQPSTEESWQTKSMVGRHCPWPFEEHGSRSRRVRKAERPRMKPLRDRRFVGCSSIDQYNIGVKLGQGTFGEVKKATHFLTGAEVALKKVTIHEEKDGMPITAIREIKLLKRLHHPSIVPIVDMAYRAPSERGRVGEVYMVEPYMDHDLNGMLENASISLNMSQIKLYMKQLFEGTLYLHQNKILHRDMKAANLLINNKGQLQIADFGLARPYHDPGRAWEPQGWKGGAQSYTGMVVTRWYRPPELLAGDRKYGPPIDMWGLGCILAEMIVKQPIFKGSSEVDQMLLISKLCGSPNESSYPGWSRLPGVKNADPSGRPDQEPDVPGQHDFGSYPRRVVEHFTSGGIVVSSDMADLIDKLLTLDPCRRMTAQEALEHRWFWQTPFPADPSAMPQYQASKELDRQKRDQQKRLHQQQQQQQQAALHPHPHHQPPPRPQMMQSHPLQQGHGHSNGAYRANGTEQAYGQPRPPSYRGLYSNRDGGRPNGLHRPYGGTHSGHYSHGQSDQHPRQPMVGHHRSSVHHPSSSQNSSQQPLSRSSQPPNPYTDL